LIERDYYQLEQAAEILKCSKDYLIYRGAKGELPIYILTGRFFVNLAFFDFFTREYLYEGSDNNKFARLSRDCLIEIEAGNWETRAMIQPRKCYAFEPFIGPREYGKDYLYDEWGRKVKEICFFELRHKNFIYPNVHTTPIEHLKHFPYPPPITIQECVLVVLPDDLRRLQESVQHAEHISNPVGNDGEPKGKTRTNCRKKEGDDKARAENVVKWVKDEGYKGGWYDKQIVDALRDTGSTLWGAKGISTYRKWLSTPEGRAVKHLLPNARRK
jgi:hypothetical protein